MEDTPGHIQAGDHAGLPCKNRCGRFSILTDSCVGCQVTGLTEVLGQRLRDETVELLFKQKNLRLRKMRLRLSKMELKCKENNERAAVVQPFHG
jgi:hypothetical protein